MKCLIIDELSIVLIDLWTDIDSRLRKISIMIPDRAFVGLSVLALVDLLLLPPVTGKFISSYPFDKGSMKNLLGLQLWHVFKYAELTEFLKQNDKIFIDLLN